MTKETPISTPRISVRTTGPCQWIIALRGLPQAKQVQREFRESGLSCSAIKQERRNGFVFSVDGSHIAGSDASGRPLEATFFG